MGEDLIPAVFVESGDDSVMCGAVSFDGRNFEVESFEPLSSVRGLKGGKTRTKALVIDAQSISSGKFNPDAVGDSRVPGCEVWIMEVVRDIDDIVDAFLSGLNKLVFPMCFFGHHSSLKEVYEASDSCIPVIIWSSGRAWGKEGIFRQVSSALSAGFRNILVMDCDGTMDDDTWIELHKQVPGLFAFSPARDSDAISSIPVVFRNQFDYSVRR